MSKTSNLRDKVEGNELDLSLCDLSVIPVRDMSHFPKATHVDLSRNRISDIPDNFWNLQHIIKLDLSKNALTSLSNSIGRLNNLKHLDLYGNNLHTLPVGMAQLRKLQWLDCSDNPLSEDILRVVGDCLDAKQCQLAAKNVLEHMRVLQSQKEREKQKLLRAQREKEEEMRQTEARDREKKKAEKRAEKEKRKIEYEEKQRLLKLAKEAGGEGREESTSPDGNHMEVKFRESRKVEQGSQWRGLACYLLLAIFVVFVAVVFGMAVFCGSKDDKNMEFCGALEEHVGSAVNNTLQVSDLCYRTMLTQFLRMWEHIFSYYELLKQ